ncbi:DUF1998 domain-containing protein [Glutamicibacter halophytocola]|uniref:DUF1998 domain-containing protein n=1 Tax=Glutamicibacter halophytocola TaxID=1933880 RepID=A0ABX5YAA4_9MICC|nr:DUF1998 domain-containing protein [Glutamicibacter halophytocola]QDY66595.1 DUF1998 domain-containing protein [Glutamicibacter halophytocola]
MSSGSIRRAQLVAPFGVGALSVLVDGTSVITAGLDHWYESSDSNPVDIKEYEAHDWRLEARLKVNSFRLPPDFRPSSSGDSDRNVKLNVPVLRFPRWCYCMYCKRLELTTLTMQHPTRCKDAKHKDWKHEPRMAQVPFVTVCTNGHIDDFPFNEWVHRSESPSCFGPLRLKSIGGAGLDGQRVVCDSCDSQRSLSGITETRLVNGEEHSNLSDRLSPDSEDLFLCSGVRPWLGQLEGSCGKPQRGALRAAGNVYFPKVESSIYLPRNAGKVSSEMHTLMEQATVSVTMSTLHSVFGSELDVNVLRNSLLKSVPPELFRAITDEELLEGYLDRFGESGNPPVDENESGNDSLSETSIWRYPEYLQIRETPKDVFLTISDPGIDSGLDDYLDRVRSVEVLRETRALRGFTRVHDDPLTLSDGKRQLRRQALQPQQDWLPAYVVKGEGIYFELNEQRLSAWESTPTAQARAHKIAQRYNVVATQRGLNERELTPRFILMHTLGHLLINELVFTCGYSSASLRERLYVSEHNNSRMAGILIYTAAGDSEGTMGGLVRMAQTDNLRSVLYSAISKARWCSSDPVCMETGTKGQGPDSCNLAACHSCSLVPETSCEEFNRFLDRGLVIGTLNDPALGYFQPETR